MTDVISTNPSTCEERSLGFAESSEDEVLAAAQRALDALDDYANRPLVWRAGLLRACLLYTSRDRPVVEG